MTIQITKPEVEALINQRLQSGVYEDAEDVILQALRCLPAKQPSTPHLDRSLQGVFEAVRGLADDVEFSRNPSTGRPVDLA
jgi:Arc/MetJ-type ribon-helix-helix transcriptional regulator